jgi:hypothetical protein
MVLLALLVPEPAALRKRTGLGANALLDMITRDKTIAVTCFILID